MLDENFQDMVVACLQRVPEFSTVAAQHVQPDLFEGRPRQLLSSIMIDFWNRYDSIMSDKALILVIKDEVAKGTIRRDEVEALTAYIAKVRKMKVAEWKFVLERLVSFIKHQRIKALIERAVVRHLPKEDFEAIERGMAEIASITTLNKVTSYDYFNDKNIELRRATRKEESMVKRVGITTGISKLNDSLNRGGWNPKELYVMLAPPKRGKTMSLLWFCNAASLDGEDVAYFSCEVSKEIASDRIDCMNANIDSKQLNIRYDRIAEKVLGMRPKGSLHIFEYPTKTLTVAEMKRQIEKLRIEKGINIGLAAADYIGIMKPSRKRDDVWVEQASITEELRGMAGELHIPVLTAQQINRAGAGKSLTKGKDVAGAYESIAIADQVITLNATDDELAEGRLRIHLAESRNNPSVTIAISTAFNFGRFFNEYLGTEI